MRRTREENTTDSIDISPLIDVVFILLIFFMVSTTFVKDFKIDLKRPGAASAEIASTKSIRVFIDAGGAISVEGKSVRPWVLQGEIRERLKFDSEKPILVVTDKDTPAEKLISVVDQCRLAGAKDIGVATEKESGA